MLIEVKNEKDFSQFNLKATKRNQPKLVKLLKKRKVKKLEFYDKPVLGAVAGIYFEDSWVMDLYSNVN